MTEVQVTALRAGHCLHPQAMSIRGGSWRPMEFPSLSMLLVHPTQGPILFDTGYDPAFMQATHPFPERLYRWLTPVTLADGEQVASQIVRLGFHPREVRHLVLSHFHADHMAGTHAFPNAAIHCARAGLEAACGASRWSAVRRGFLTSLIPADMHTRARFFEDGRKVALSTAFAPFAEGVDILGDGSLAAVELPGHCPGHWGLAVRDSAHGDHFMVADAAWSLDAIRRNMPAPALSSGFLGNTSKTRETLRMLNELSLRNQDMRITPCHCPERAAQALART
jgi:glyoxylase-like metal-dependent hydrolase (beta-lactamase superfamily II)